MKAVDEDSILFGLSLFKSASLKKLAPSITALMNHPSELVQIKTIDLIAQVNDKKLIQPLEEKLTRADCSHEIIWHLITAILVIDAKALSKYAQAWILKKENVYQAAAVVIFLLSGNETLQSKAISRLESMLAAEDSDTKFWA